MTIKISQLVTPALPTLGASNMGAVSVPYHHENSTDTAEDLNIRIGNTRDFFADLSATRLRLGPARDLDLTGLPTEVRGGKLYFKFVDGSKMALDAVVAELRARAILNTDPSRRPAIIINLQRDAMHNDSLIKEMVTIQDKYKVRIERPVSPAGLPSAPRTAPTGTGNFV